MNIHRILNMFKKDPACGFPLDDLPEEILITVFCFLPVKDLKNCCLVCRKWRDIVTSQTLWKEKCERDKRILPFIIFQELPHNYYLNIYLKNPYGRNLVKNPSGTAGLSYWKITHNDGEGWKVENPPQGSDPVPDTNIQYCFATSYGLSEKFQIIDLIKEGVHPEVLDQALLDIEISEFHAARFDCGSIYTLQVKLLAKNGIVLEEYNSGKIEETQWAGKRWSQEKHVFSNYKPGVRYIKFIHSGKDTQFWAGHYGSKMSQATVKFIKRS
ncbi:F-box only protein 6-like [Centruroides sculpturatus]|uniref:F-box only protein 6-like n=1 Tax=Centruroides sculpturatus TaxID=218467 RepID=UPI000C6E8FA0|nr:F-box only protein 6-like [Centruroides sculpturatus]